MANLTDLEGDSIPSWGPVSKLVAITKNDTTDLSALGIRALWVGTGGDIAIVALNDADAVTITNVADGTLLPILVKQVKAANTTASNIVGWI